MQNRFSPLRYPGGKGKITEYIRTIFEENGLNDGHYVEPYAGGAAVALSLLFLENASHIHINDLNKSIHAFWYCVLNETEDLCRKISATRVCPTQWRVQKAIQNNKENEDMLSLGYSTFFLNRANRSGIINGGMIGGVEQKGNWLIDARFNKEDLIKKIQKIADYKSRISLYNLDACVLLKTVVPTLPNKTLVYLDPPYYVKGNRLYQNHYNHEDHIAVGSVVQKDLKRKWVVSYDDVQPIHDIYEKRRKKVYGIGYSARNVYKGSEVLIYSDDLIIPDVENPLMVAA